MKKRFYHKLVRDRIPEIIEKTGKQYQVRQVCQDELQDYALKKLREEVQEFIENPCPEEAGDILEILEFICARAGIKHSLVVAHQSAKRITKGSFDMGFVLEWAEDQ